MEENTKKTNWFVRVLILAFCLMLVAMIVYRYFCVDPTAEINAGIVTLLCLLLVLVLSESFDNFSIGKLVTITREIKKKEKEVEKLEKLNSQFLAQLITISNTHTQTQSHTNVYGDYHVVPTVQKASEEEVLDKQSSEPNGATVNNEPARQRTNWRNTEKIGLQKYLQQRALHPSNVIVDAKLVNQFQGIDPISNMQPIFDGYIKEADHETFIELRSSLISPLFRERLYVMLSKINHYRIAKRVEAHLDLVLIRLPNQDARPYHQSTEDRYLEDFEPAVASGLLKVVAVEFTEEEANSCRE
jgi:hypothetical protein